MALFKHTYSGLITRGLGMPACCGMMTMAFGVFKCTIQVTPPPPPPVYTGGGGAIGGMRSTSVPLPGLKKVKSDSRVVTFSLKMASKQVTKSYVVNTKKAKILVSAINIATNVTKNIKVAASAISNAFKRVVARMITK